ncbi:MAG: hypothetical protein LAN36_12950 [Acidobacteriia bacterium]|nr:hypothetical protein [Terriglobia bacterium]
MKAVWVALLIVATFCAIVLSAYYCLFGFHLDLEIKPVELGILAVNVFIALFVTQYFQEKASNLRAEKDLLISDLRDVLVELKSSREALISCHDASRINKSDKKTILSALRRVANGIGHVESALGMSQCSPLIRGFDNITDAYLDYKGAATGGGFPFKVYTQDQISEQERAYRKLATKLNALLFQINRHS